MRRIICRFEDGPTFLEHIRRGKKPSDPFTFSFLGEFGLRHTETIRVAIIIDDPGERHDLHLTIGGRRPTQAHTGEGPRWRYDAQPTREDAVWLQMLVAKFSTAQRLNHQAA